jgi:hypothetical protein
VGHRGRKIIAYFEAVKDIVNGTNGLTFMGKTDMPYLFRACTQMTDASPTMQSEPKEAKYNQTQAFLAHSEGASQSSQ